MECVCEALSDYAKECEELAAKALFALDPDRFLDMRRPSQIVSEVIAQLIHAINSGWEEENLGVRTADAGIPPVSSWNPPAVPGAMTDEGEKTPPATPVASAAASSSNAKLEEASAPPSPQQTTGVLSFVTPDQSQRSGLPPSGIATLENSSVGTGASTPSSPFASKPPTVRKQLPTLPEEDVAFKEGGGFQIGPRPSWL
jgi:hypothetical protein